ncbi:AP-1 complex subunit gamma-1 [Blyttiomyces sp. JEL0837]|nr:AP-1 complex subunit gamma-1 [Blyttiomyces sp. JEL0837]
MPAQPMVPEGASSTSSSVPSATGGAPVPATINDLQDLDFFGLGTPAAAAPKPASPMGSMPPPLIAAPMGGAGLLSDPMFSMDSFAARPSSADGKETEASLFNKNGLQVSWKYKVTPQNDYQAVFKFLNTTPVPFTNFNFQLAVPKSMDLKLMPMTATVIPALNQGQVFQQVTITNRQRENVRLRFKISYQVNGANVEETGEYTSP